MNTVSYSAAINDYLLVLGPDGTLTVQAINNEESVSQVTLNAEQACALFAFFQRPDVIDRLESPPAD
ncbi:MAG: hypothetical protein MI924_14095 [Chloroflexales bacterium]|nr:hypothetical protein [Chloroflexales bacterium]